MINFKKKYKKAILLFLYNFVMFLNIDTHKILFQEIQGIVVDIYIFIYKVLYCCHQIVTVRLLFYYLIYTALHFILINLLT